MKITLPVVHGLMTRRLLINYRVQPETVARQLPAPFRPKLIQGRALAGVCLIRLEALRPRGVPAFLSLASENAAHRIAVEWDDCGVIREGVFIPRRDTDSRLNALTGGRFFPGVHHHASFWTAQSPGRFKIEVRSDDGEVFVRVAARVADSMPCGSVLGELPGAVDFFRQGACGWSPGLRPGSFDGLRLHTDNWRLEPLTVERVESSWFANPGQFPSGSVEFDSAFLMRDIKHEWQTLPTVVSQTEEAA